MMTEIDYYKCPDCLCPCVCACHEPAEYVEGTPLTLVEQVVWDAERATYEPGELLESANHLLILYSALQEGVTT